MSLLVFNGSPRGQNSNSEVIIDWFIVGDVNVKKLYLKKVKQFENFIQEAKDYQKYLFVFPLYVDGMPAQVKQFFEDMNHYQDIFKGKQVCFIIHSGFSEAIHLKNLEEYLYRLTDRMTMYNFGVFLIPGSEGFRLMPSQMLRIKSEKVTSLGRSYRLNQPYNEKIKTSLEGPLVLSKAKLVQFKVLKKAGLLNLYWNNQLKANEAFEKRFDAPYK